MDYISVKVATDKWCPASRIANYYCANGRIKGAVKISSVWVISKDAQQPPDRRRKNNNEPK